MDERTCAVPDCDRTIDRLGARGWCAQHYRRWRRHGDPLGVAERKPRQCLVSDCDRPANVPGSGRGWCATHYSRWQRTGSLELTRTKNFCSIDSCDAPAYSRGYCSKHYSRLIRKGDPLARNRGEVVDGKRICPRCQLDKPVERFDKSWCRSCAAGNARERRRKDPSLYLRPKWTVICERCDSPFQGDGRRRRFCSRICMRSAVNERSLAARRARLTGAWVESFNRTEIFERDGYVCQICQEPTDATATWPDGSIPTIDHITPLARGGEHSRANVQTAHLTCNLRKGVRLTA